MLNLDLCRSWFEIRNYVELRCIPCDEYHLYVIQDDGHTGTVKSIKSCTPEIDDSSNFDIRQDLIYRSRGFRREQLDRRRESLTVIPKNIALILGLMCIAFTTVSFVDFDFLTRTRSSQLFGFGLGLGFGAVICIVVKEIMVWDLYKQSRELLLRGRKTVEISCRTNVKDQ